MKKECGEFGYLEYRLPNIPQAMNLLGDMGISARTVESEQNELILLAKLLERMGPFITKISIKIEEKQVKKYNDLLDHFSLMPFLTEIATDILNSLQFDTKKKA